MKAILAAFLAFVGLTTTAILLATGQIGPRTPLTIVTTPGHAIHEPMLRDWAKANRVDLTLRLLPETAMTSALLGQAGARPDVIWTDSRLWLDRLDPEGQMQHVTALTRQPVVLAIKARIAQEMGWTDRETVPMAEIAQAAKEGWFRFGIGSATQGSLGAATYLGLFPAFSDGDGPLDAAMLKVPETLDAVLDFLAQVDRTAPGALALADLLVAHPDHLDAMLNTEAEALRANRLLTEAGGSALQVIYPGDLPAVLDSTLGFLPTDPEELDREEAFHALVAHLKSAETTAVMQGLGLRAVGPEGDSAEPQGAAWTGAPGLRPAQAVTAPDPLAADLVAQALTLYQTTLRKPSLTVWLLDHSYSMGGAPINQMRQAMTTLLDPRQAVRHGLQPTVRDAAVILPFNEIIADPIRVEAASPVALERARRFLASQQVSGADSDIYYALYEAYEELARLSEDGTLGRSLPAIVLLTDAPSAQASREALVAHRRATPLSPPVPIIAIAYGEADHAELQALADLTGGTMIDAEGDIAGALRAARAFNN
ncbi:substrate-binding domain-containing protein [Ponticoccus gilvus]|nr:substrate-binding domain-containing protein [Enemella evansiae]